jgi:murein DD-endopeptidase MepM/ murein hydrolase activator NlpD
MRRERLVPEIRPASVGCLLASLPLLFLGALAAAQDTDSRSASTPAASEPPSTIERGRRLTERFYAGDLAQIWESMTKPLRETLGGQDALAAFRAKVLSDLGTEVEVLEERQSPQGDIVAYRRLARFSNVSGTVSITWAFNDQTQIAGFRVEPTPRPAPSPHLDYVTRAELKLPFEGEWYVFWGGRSLTENHHAVSKDQRFAYDFVVLRGGASHRGAGERNEDYYCFGKAVLAPAEARVVAAVDRFPDQLPGRADAEHPAGNHVVLDLGRGEYAVLAHLRAGSVSVAPGDRVAAGEELGRCGNSGNTSEPHLHFHLQDGPTIGSGNGLPAFFRDYFADGLAVERSEPVRGETVSNEARRGAAPRGTGR